MQLNRCVVYVLVCILYCCQSNHNTAERFKMITLDTREALKEADVSSFFEADVDFVKLETTEENLVRADAPKAISEKYVWMGDNVTKQIYMFNRQGKFIRKIGNVGRGPGEYVDWSGFYYKEDSLYVHDRLQSKLLAYSVADSGFYERKVSPAIYSSSVTGSSGYLYFITNYSNGFNLIRMNLKNGDQDYRLPYEPDIEKSNSFWGLNHYSANYRDSVLFALSRNDTIYQIYRDSCWPQYVVDFPVNKLPKQLLQKSGSEILQTAFDKGFICGIDRLYQSSCYIMGDFSEGRKAFLYLYDKANGNTIVAESFVLASFGGLPLINPIVTDEDEVFCYYDALLFKEFGRYMAEKKFFANESDRDKILRVLSSLSENENPVMVTMRLKKDSSA